MELTNEAVQRLIDKTSNGRDTIRIGLTGGGCAGFQSNSMKYNFKEAQKILHQNKCEVTFQSLTSDKIHKEIYTVPKLIQSAGDKILVLNVKSDKWEDVEINTIQDIRPI